MSFMKLITACAMACAAATAAPLATAAESAAAAQPAAKAITAKKPASKKAKAAKAAGAAGAVGAAAAVSESSLAEHKATSYACELGNKITIYSNADDSNSIVMRWKNRLHRLTREATSTGAQRFENKIAGLIWIGIPAKGMLLDSKVNRQLANECKTSDQALGL
ncbi:hypothetical protein SAMN05518865_11011 [Duganella sp. CF458]|uniref:hypothetical protein n=1 Tax=Duganella sp. CF458 TaxID=1884368 RepID=UPI0008EE41D3|nr:hypothetical protein [Duganella sp. CF458]SFG25415.1 hypothetical protein SAMN05518865_11011 [Duganella sp. CF458]